MMRQIKQGLLTNRGKLDQCIILPIIAINIDVMTPRIKKAGIDAMIHFTMKKTIERKGILMSVTITRCSSSFINPPVHSFTSQNMSWLLRS